MEKYILSIDQGTTSSRAILFDKNKNMAYMSQKEFSQIFTKPGYVEHDANEIYYSVLYCLEKLILDNKISPNQIESVAITNQRETTVLWDKRTGRPVYNAIVWQSRQSIDICERLKANNLTALIKEKTGLLIDSYFSATKIMWILENVEGAKELMDSGNLMFGTIDTWLVYKFTNNHYTDVTNASRTLLYDIKNLRWSKTLTELFGINMNILPKVLDSAADYGKINIDIFKDYDIHIHSVIGDQQAALYGQGCTNELDCKITYGTGLFMLLNTKEKIVESNNSLLTTIAYSINGEVSYALEGSVFVAGSLIQWLRDGLKLFSNAKDSESIANQTDTNLGVYVVPSFTGLGAPYWDMEAKGAIFGLTRGVSRRHIARASLEAIAYQAKDLVLCMEVDSNSPINNLHIDGGASLNNFLCQFQSDILNKAVIRPKLLETTALGTAMLASTVTNFFSDENIERNTIFEPKMSLEERTNLYNGWLKAVNATRAFK